MNELLFFSHMILVFGFIFAALRLGPNCLIALIALQGVLANLFVVKQISLFGFAVTCSDVFAIGGILSLNLLQQYFGKEEAKRAIQISFFSLLFFALMSQIHLLYSPTLSDETHGAFALIFSQSPRIIAASIATFTLIQQFDLRFFGLLKGAFAAKALISVCVSQFLDTLLFTFLGLYGFVESVVDVIIVSFFVKSIVILASAPLIVFAKRFVKDELPI